LSRHRAIVPNSEYVARRWMSGAAVHERDRRHRSTSSHTAAPSCDAGLALAVACTMLPPTVPDIAARRLHAQRLTGEPFTSAVETVRSPGVVQGPELPHRAGRR